MAKAKSKKQQLQELQQKEHDKKFIKTAKKKKKHPEPPYSDNPTPGHPGWNLAARDRKTNSVNM